MLYSFLLYTLLPLVFSAPIPVEDTQLNLILLAVENDLPVISGSIADVADLITATEETLALLTGTSTTQNGLSGACKELTVIFARGTADPGNVGFLTGPAWFDAIGDIIGSSNLAVQGVNDYSASVTGFLEGGDPAGGSSMAAEVEQAFSQCPNTKVVMGGYSQGGQIVHNAAALIPAATMAKVSAVVIFGDPDDGTSVTNAADKTLVICHVGDDICLHGDLILLPHLTYAEDAVTAATYAVSMAGL